MLRAGKICSRSNPRPRSETTAGCDARLGALDVRLGNPQRSLLARGRMLLLLSANGESISGQLRMR